jgi:uncharacterized protein YjbJ (UPF0337 family)
LQSTKDKSKGKIHNVKGNLKEKVGRVANKPNLEVEGQREQVSGRIQKKIGKGEEILGAESAWGHFCALMGDANPPSLRYIDINRVRQR